MKINYKKIVDNCVHGKAHDQHALEIFTRVFEMAIENIADAPIRMAQIELTDFPFIEDPDLKRYTLKISKQNTQLYLNCVAEKRGSTETF